MATIEHDFNNGLTVRNGTIVADYQKFYQNVYPTRRSVVGRGESGGHRVQPRSLSALDQSRQRLQPDRLHLQDRTGPVFHTIGFGTEFGRQTGVDIRNTGLFPNGTATGINTITQNPFEPTYFGTINFVHHYTAVNNGDGVSSPDSNSKYALNIQSGYVRDTIDITRAVQVIAGARFDRFDMSSLDMNINASRSRVDNLVSPQAALIIKPIDNLSVYTAYSVSYLPASGDQFSALTNGTLILQPQKFENTEIGMKWNINPKLLFSTAVYNLDRTNQPIPVPNALDRLRTCHSGWSDQGARL